MRQRIGIALLALLALAAAIGFQFAGRTAANGHELAERQCIDNVANTAGDDDQGDAVEAQIAACNVEAV